MATIQAMWTGFKYIKDIELTYDDVYIDEIKVSAQ